MGKPVKAGGSIERTNCRSSQPYSPEAEGTAGHKSVVVEEKEGKVKSLAKKIYHDAAASALDMALGLVRLVSFDLPFRPLLGSQSRSEPLRPSLPITSQQTPPPELQIWPTQSLSRRRIDSGCLWA